MLVLEAGSDAMTTHTTTTLHRYAWQAGGQTVGRGASLVSLVIAARTLGLDQYGRFVILLALLEASMIPWKTTVLQAAAVRSRSTEPGGWAATTARWWVIGAVLLGPAAFVFDGVGGLVSLLAASAASAVMFIHVPGLILAGRQRRFAIGTVSAQMSRLIVIAALVLLDRLTPQTALLAVGAGFIVGALVIWTRSDSVIGSPRWFSREVGTEGLRWAQMHAPILVVALLLGLQSAGGFDLLYKLIQALAQLLGGIGVLMLPAFLRGGEPASRVLARSLRLPTVLGLVVAVGVAVALGPFLDLVTGNDLGLGFAPAAFGVTLVLAPWMGVSWTALVVLHGSRWLMPSQAVVSGISVGASFLAVGGVWWAAVAVSAASLLGSVVRWLGLRSLGQLPGRGWLSAEAWKRDVRWLRDAARRGQRA